MIYPYLHDFSTSITFSKESVLEFLLDSTICETASHIRNLKDTKTLKLTHNPGFDKKASGTANEYYDTQSSRFVCPVVGKAFLLTCYFHRLFLSCLKSFF